MFLFTVGLLLQTQAAARSSPLPQDPPPPAPAALSVAAASVTQAPVIDGIGNDGVWATTQVITGFRETRPVEDADPKLATEARIAYDERHLYVLMRAFDPHPDSIVRRFARRDNDVAS